MPVPLLFVELPAIENDRREAAALIDACTSALVSGSCVLARDAPEGQPSAIAVVAFPSGDRQRAIIEVGRRRGPNEAWLAQELNFQNADALTERYRSVGLAIATLFHEVEEGRNDRSRSVKSPSEPALVATEPLVMPAATAARHGPLWLTLGVSGISAASLSLPRWGVHGAASLAPWSPPLSLVVSARYASASPREQFALSWTTLSFGAAAELPLSPIFLRLSAEALLERLAAQARPEDDGPGGHSSEWLGGARLGAQAGWPQHGKLAVVVGAGMERTVGATDVKVRRERLLTVSSTSWVATVSLEYRPFGR